MKISSRFKSRYTGTYPVTLRFIHGILAFWTVVPLLYISVVVTLFLRVHSEDWNENVTYVEILAYFMSLIGILCISKDQYGCRINIGVLMEMSFLFQ